MHPYAPNPNYAQIPLTTPKTKVLTAAVLCTAMGLLAVIGGFFGKGAGMVIPLVFGALLLLLGVWILTSLPKITRPRALVIAREGIHCQDPRGASWQLAWPELAQCVITTAYHEGVGQVYNPKTWRVRLEWRPADRGFPARHPELARFAGRFSNWPDGYGYPLGSRIDLIGPLDRALRQFGVGTYGGVVQLGRQIGFGYV